MDDEACNERRARRTDVRGVFAGDVVGYGVSTAPWNPSLPDPRVRCALLCMQRSEPTKDS